MIGLVLSAFIAVSLSTTVFAAQDPGSIVGRAAVIDGDTLEIHGERIRINGIDAPESAQLCKEAKGQSYRCGAVAAKALAEFVSASRPTRCEFVTRDRYGRFVGDCFRADGANIASFLVRSGLALDWPRYSNGKYAREQHQARVEHLGLWNGEFTPPWEWRARQKGQVEITGSLPSEGCRIKGNINRKGRRIYHMLGQRSYDKTRINQRKGERWFCSEAEARSAGWTAAGQ